MSKRHRNEEIAPIPRADVRAHAHNERHRIHSELHLVVEAVEHGTEPDDIDEPGPNWKSVHHHGHKREENLSAPKRLRHWKTKDWKRRTNNRKARNRAYRTV